MSSDDILDLKVADIACGSGAFLVAAARYLAARLVEAWRREGVATGTAHELYVHAIRTVVARCLYGADINAMAVEMCKLSLWLVSLDPKLPFSFVDDKVLHGNSLLGLTDAEQLQALHIAPAKAAAAPLFDLREGAEAIRHLDIDGVLTRATRLRRSLASEVNDDDPQRSAATKRRQWREYQGLTRQLADVSDGVIAAGLRLGGKPGKALTEAYENLRLAVGLAYPADSRKPDRTMLDRILEAGLTPTVATDYARWKPLHWILAVPDVMERGGFDAVIGNPPFLGGTKISGALGSNFRDWISNILSGGQGGGRADIVAYFFLRAFSLLTAQGNLGLIATNTVAQGDTREIGLDRMVAGGLTVSRATQSRSWPAASANLKYAAVWGARGSVSPNAERIADDVPAKRISTLLEPAGRIDGHPFKLTENRNVTFEGCKPYGAGFVLDPEEASEWIVVDPLNVEVLFPYLTGEDLNSRPDTSPSRWIIDFYDRSEVDAKRYSLPYVRVLEQVKPERQKANRKAIRERWWQYADKRPAMRKAIANLENVLVIARVSDVGLPARVPTGHVFSDRLTVFASDSFALQALLSSSLHTCWLIKYGTTHESRLTYGPNAVFETFPFPTLMDHLNRTGEALDAIRREIMLRRRLGLTKLYNLINNPDIAASTDPDIARLRQIHVELDEAVMDAYGWDDIQLEHGFHTYRQMRRWTVSPAARVELLDRLLEENHRRAAAQGEALAPTDVDEEIEGEDA
ncbi:hypothetical protein O1M63_28295 [Streptomyces mirabilis]|nr:hypothetical protein [Streptomyces mirabilis]